MTAPPLLSRRPGQAPQVASPIPRPHSESQWPRKLADIAVLSLIIVKKGDADIAGLTDAASTKPRRLGPKRASKIRKLFNLDKEDDVRTHVIRRKITKDDEKKSYTKAPKIQRLITPGRLQHKRQIRNEKRKRWEKSAALAKEYNELIAKRLKEKRDEKAKQHAKRRSASKRESVKA